MNQISYNHHRQNLHLNLLQIFELLIHWQLYNFHMIIANLSHSTQKHRYLQVQQPIVQNQSSTDAVKSGCATTSVAIHCAKLLAQQLNVTCHLPVELHPCLWHNANKNRPPGKQFENSPLLINSLQKEPTMVLLPLPG